MSAPLREGRPGAAPTRSPLIQAATALRLADDVGATDLHVLPPRSTLLAVSASGIWPVVAERARWHELVSSKRWILEETSSASRRTTVSGVPFPRSARCFRDSPRPGPSRCSAPAFPAVVRTLGNRRRSERVRAGVVDRSFGAGGTSQQRAVCIVNTLMPRVLTH